MKGITGCDSCMWRAYVSVCVFVFIMNVHILYLQALLRMHIYTSVPRVLSFLLMELQS